ncbi:MAG: hypothetical protein ACR2GC_05345 [Methyloceanibacter sp.]|uniref:hypothetical protein n=1 Tax=Methyloceanibacter sp. TaxID=1965321 RepID=UPI003D9B88D2
MKRSVELDTLKIANDLGNLDIDLHFVQLACDGLDCNDGEGTMLANRLFEIREKLAAIADEIHPGPPVVEEVAHIRRVADAKIEQLVKDADGASA